MLRFLIKRTLIGAVTLFFIITLTFFLIAGAPGDPIATKVGQMPEQARTVIEEYYGLNEHILTRYVKYVSRLLLQGDFGESVVYTGRSVNDIIRKNAPVSVTYAVPAILLQLVFGVAIGLYSGLKHDSLQDQIIRVLIVLSICVPGFVFAALLQYYLAFQWKLVPVFGWGKAENLLLPLLVSAVGGIGSYAKYMRQSTITTLSEDFVLMARAKGCRRGRVLRKHVLRNSVLPIVTFIGPSIAGIFSGSFIIENIFAIPGLGKYYTQAVSDMDYTMILGLTIFYAVLYVAALIFTDIFYGIVDPRIKLGKSEI